MQRRTNAMQKVNASAYLFWLRVDRCKVCQHYHRVILRVHETFDELGLTEALLK